MEDEEPIYRKWNKFAAEHNIEDPFEEHFKELDKYAAGPTFVFLPPSDEWKKRRDKYLRLKHTFMLWELHKIKPWREFKWELGNWNLAEGKELYAPCDCADRQCVFLCQYFDNGCTRGIEELENPVLKLLEEESLS